MKLTIIVGGSQLSAVDALAAIKRSRLSADDPSPFQTGEHGILRDINGNKIGEWKTEETDFRKEHRRYQRMINKNKK